MKTSHINRPKIPTVAEIPGRWRNRWANFPVGVPHPQAVPRFQGLGTHYWDARFGFSASREESWKRGVELAGKAVAIDEKLPEGHIALASLHLYRKQYDEALAEAEKAVALGPNNSANLGRAAQVMHYSGRFEEALRLIKNAMRLNPHYSNFQLRILGGALRFTEQHDQAIAAFKEQLRRRKGKRAAFLPNLHLASIYGELGRLEEARAHVKAALEDKPDASTAWMQKYLKVFRDPAHAERVLAGLRKAGLPEKSRSTAP